MAHKVRVYVTTRDDPVEDLDSVKTGEELEAWKKAVREHALEVFEHDEVTGKMVEDVMKYTILECYAVIAYPPTKMMEAQEEAGKPLMAVIRENKDKLTWDLEETGVSAKTSDQITDEHRFLNPDNIWENFTYGLVADKQMGENMYEVDLEFVVKSPA